MNNHLKTRTFIVLAVLAVFTAAMHPLSPRDFYQTFRSTLRAGQESACECLIGEARELQKKSPELSAPTALGDAAERGRVELKEMLELPDAFDNSECIAMVRKAAASSIRLGLDLNGGVEFVLDLIPDYGALASDRVSRKEAEARLEKNFSKYRSLAIEALCRRLESRNIFETEITPFGARAISLKAPLVSRDEKDRLQKLIGMSNKLEFRLVHPESDALLQSGRAGDIPLGFRILTEETRRREGAPQGVSCVVADRSEMNGNAVEEAFVSKGEAGQLAIALRFNSDGARRFSEITEKNVGRRLAIVMDGKLYCAPVINGAITGGQAEITGEFSLEDAQNIADALTSGSFPFQIDVAAVYDTDPTLGSDNVKNGIVAGLAALALLAAFMIIYYHTAGVIAVLALGVNVVLILGAMAAFGATLTMPGIAGIILTLGMAVDANVLVFERMREEAERGKSASSIVELGFQKAYSSVMDGNLTTLIVALILMYFGSGAVKGFAISLAIGIAASLFTALFMTRVIFDWLLKLSPHRHFSMMRFFSRPKIDFLKQSRVAIPISLACMCLSVGVFCWRGKEMLAVDFTGGTLLSGGYDTQIPVAQLEQQLSGQGMTARVSYKSNAAEQDGRRLEVLLNSGSGADGHAVAERVAKQLNGENPKLNWRSISVTGVGGMVGMETAKNAVIAVLLAFFGMIVYVTFRYELIYAAAGIFALLHDVVIAAGVFALLGRELSLPVAAGLLTIVGYSINDTIVIFDRIREEKKLHPERGFGETVNLSLNATLSRTILTSLTTFLVVFVMFVAGGIAINDFMLVIMLGIVIGSYSSLYIASPIVVAYCRRHGLDSASRSGEKASRALDRGEKGAIVAAKGCAK